MSIDALQMSVTKTETLVRAKIIHTAFDTNTSFHVK